MGSLAFLLWLTWQRLRANWALTLASFVGVLLAVTLIAVAVIHSDTLAVAGLRDRADPAVVKNDLGLEIMVPTRPLSAGDYRKLDTQVRETVASRLGDLAVDIFSLGTAQAIRYRLGDDPQTRNGVITMDFWEDLEQHVEVTQGRWPRSIAGGESGDGVETIIGVNSFKVLNEVFGWEVGTRLTLMFPFPEPETELEVTIVGVFNVVDLDDPFWFFGQLPELALGDFGEEFNVHLYVEPDVFVERVAPAFPKVLANYIWEVGVDVGSFTPGNVGQAKENMRLLEADIEAELPRADALSPLVPVVERFERALAFSRVPLFLFISLVIAAVLYYLALVLWLLTRSRSAEAALVRSRGASRLTVGAFLGLGEGLVVVLPAVVLGPFIGLFLSQLLPLGSAPEFESISAGLSAPVFVYAGLVGLASIVVFWTAGYLVAGRSIVEVLRERYGKGGRPAFYRYSLDLGVLALVGLFWWRVQGRGGFVTDRLLGIGVETDLTLLVGPALGILGMGLVLLRVFPYLLRFLAWLAGLFAGATIVYGLTRMARDPLPYGALAVLLLFSTSLGIFGAAFGPSITGSDLDQARYRVGADFVVPTPWIDLREEGYNQAQTLSGAAGVTAAAPVTQGTLSKLDTPISGGSATVLAVDPDALAEAAWWRADFAGEDLDALLSRLKRPIPTEVGIPLPEGTEKIGVWVRPDRLLPSFNIWARYRDTQGLYESLLVGRMSTPKWTYVEAPLPDRAHLVPPFSLVGLFVTGPNYTFLGSGLLRFDDVTVTLADGQRFVVEPFEELGAWIGMPNLDFSPDIVRIEPEAAYSGENGATFTWLTPLGGQQRGIMLPAVALPIPAIGSLDFNVGDVVVGEVFAQAMPIQVVATAEHFPTLGIRRGPYVVMDLETIDLYQRSLPSARSVNPTEFWVGLEEGADPFATLANILEGIPGDAGIVVSQQRLENVLQNPLGGGSWRGLGFLGLGTVIATAVLGLGLYSLLMFRQSQLELGLLRAVGFTRWQIGLVLGLSGLVVTVVGGGVGVVTGTLLGRWVLSFLNITVLGNDVRPPAVLDQDPWILALTYGGVVAATIFATILVTTLAARLSLARVLRQSE